MDALGIVWGKSAMPFDLWQALMHRLQSDGPAQIIADTKSKKVEQL